MLRGIISRWAVYEELQYPSRREKKNGGSEESLIVDGGRYLFVGNPESCPFNYLKEGRGIKCFHPEGLKKKVMCSIKGAFPKKCPLSKKND